MSKITKPTSIPKELVQLNFTKLYNVSRDENISMLSGYMNISDMCIRSIVGTRKMNGTKCSFSSKSIIKFLTLDLVYVFKIVFSPLDFINISFTFITLRYLFCTIIQ